MRAYDERLSVPGLWWLLAAGCVAMLGAELYAGLGTLAAVLTYAVLGVACGATMLNWGAVRVRVADGELTAGAARLSLAEAGDVIALDERETRAMRGTHCDPTAYLLVRPYLKRAVYIATGDATNPEPYWLIGTRRPEELAAAIERSRIPPR